MSEDLPCDGRASCCTRWCCRCWYFYFQFIFLSYAEEKKSSSFENETKHIRSYLRYFHWLTLRVIYVDRLLEYDLKELRNNLFSSFMCYILVTGPTAWPLSVKLLRRSRSFNFDTLTPVFCRAYKTKEWSRILGNLWYVLPMNEDGSDWIRYPSMHRVQFDIPNQLIYVVNLLYSTWFCLEMIETNKEFNLYILFFFFRQLTNKNTATLPHDSSIEQPMRKIMTHLSLINDSYIEIFFFFIDCLCVLNDIIFFDTSLLSFSHSIDDYCRFNIVWFRLDWFSIIYS